MKFTFLSSLCLSAFYQPDFAVAQTDGLLQQPFEFRSDSPNLEFDLSISLEEHVTVAASSFTTRLLGGTLPGPTVRVKKGDWLYINFQNELLQQNGVNTDPNDFSYPDSTNLHFHGGHISGDRPGDDTTIIVDAGDSFQYEVFFPQFHMGGTHWIHPHRHGSGTLQVAGGAASVMIVEDEPGDVPPEVEDAEEVILMTQLFDTGRMTTTTRRSGDGRFNLQSNVGNRFMLVNGQYRPTLEITAGEWQRWRVVYAGWDRDPLDLEMITGGVCEMNLLAKDGIYINDYPRPLTFYPVSTAGRADIMVRCSETGSFPVNSFLGELFTLNIVAPNGPIDVSTPPTSGFNFPTPLYLNDLRFLTPTPGCTCDTVLANNQVNGLSYDPDVFVHKVAEGSLVQRNLEGIAQHPYHQHVYPFQLTDFSGINQVDADYHRIGDYHDTIMIRSSNQIQIRYEANNFLGRMAVHCHRLTHSDIGMLTFEDVVDPSTGGICECSPRTNAPGLTREPTDAPGPPASESPTVAPVEPPSESPTVAPVDPPSESPTVAPIDPPPASESPTVAPVDPPPASESPTVAPVDPPPASENPTVAPVDPPPPSECVDSPLRAIVEGQNNPRNCAFISRNGYCSQRRYWSHCRDTCDRCDRCQDSGLSFRFRPDPNRNRQITENCRYISRNPSLCELDDIATTCPAACGLC